METYSQREVFGTSDFIYYRKARRFVQRMPSYGSRGEQLRCHEVARAVVRVVGLPLEFVRDGYYELACQHSWIVLPSGHVLDAYAVGRHPPVQLVAVVTTLPKRFNERDIGVVVDERTVSWLVERAGERP
jgi:hypothetical protein